MSKRIPLRNNVGEIRAYAEVDDEDFDRVNKYKWHLTSLGRARSVIGGYLHNFIMGLRGVDHRNRVPLDCQKRNLRPATQAQNLQNRAKNRRNTSGFKGVCRMGKSRWQARIGYQGTKIWLGTFDNPRDAAKAYDAAAKKYYGEFACTNFPRRYPRLPRYPRL